MSMPDRNRMAMDIGAEAAVGEHDIAGEEKGKELAKQFAFMSVQSTFSPVQQGAAGQAETSDQLGDGKATAFLLAGRLRESPLIGGGIGHGDPGAIDDFDASTAPELLAGNTPLQLDGRMPMDIQQRVVRETGTGAAIGGGAGTGPGLAMADIPGLDFANGFAAGTLRGKHLREEGPEGQTLGKEASAAVSAPRRRLEQSGRHPWCADLAELAQSRLFERQHLAL